MSERVYSEAELKRIAFRGSARVLAVHCGFCLDANGKPDRRKKLGWLSIPRGEFDKDRIVWDTTSITPPHFWCGLSCPKCMRSLKVYEEQAQAGLTEIFLARNNRDKRTTLLAIATELAARNYLSEENEIGLRVADEPRFQEYVCRLKASRQEEPFWTGRG